MRARSISIRQRCGARDETSASSPMAARCGRRSRRPLRSRSEGIEAEVVDLRTLRPLDDATIIASVRRPAAPSSSTRAGAREAWPPRFARASSNRRSGISMLPIGRVCSEEVPIPYPGIWKRRPSPPVPKSSPWRKRRWEKPKGSASWPSSACLRSAPTWKRERWSSG